MSQSGKEAFIQNESSALQAKTYLFKVEFSWKKLLWRIIEVHEDQTLEHLHMAIQDAFDWAFPFDIRHVKKTPAEYFIWRSF